MNQFRKALTAAGVGLVGALGASLADGNLTLPELLISLGVGLTAGATVYQVKNSA